MKYTNLTAYIPIQFVWRGNFDSDSKSDRMAKEILAQSEQIEFTLLEGKTVIPKIEILNSQDPAKHDELQIWSDAVFDKIRIPKKQKPNRNAFTENRLFFKISSTIAYRPIDEKFVSTGGETFSVSPEQTEYLYRFWAKEDFLKRIYDLILVANIASVGSLGIGEGIIIQDSVVHGITDVMNARQFENAAQLAQTIGWPKLQKLDFIQVWRWATTQTGFLEGHGENSVTRALSAFSYFWTFDKLIDINRCGRNLYSTEHFEIRFSGELT